MDYNQKNIKKCLEYLYKTQWADIISDSPWLIRVILGIVLRTTKYIDRPIYLLIHTIV